MRFMDIDFLLDKIPALLEATKTTIVIYLGTLLVGNVLGILVALLRLYGPRFLRPLLVGYTWFGRSVPALVVLFFIYYGMPSIGFSIRPVPAAIIGLGFVTGAYLSEIFRAGMLSIGSDQYYAAASLGLSFMRTLRRILIPQAIRVVLPPWTSNSVALVKGTALAGVIAANELTGRAWGIVSLTYRPFEILITAALIYLVLTSAVMGLSSMAERYWRLK
jgi:His/Glu/Gln/Arg/opine family amino acid ABC transporter permease subunit